MGRSYVWVCDERREYIDPYPLNEPVLFEWCDLGDWRDCKVRLLSDHGGGNDEYYLLTSKDELGAQAFGGTMANVYRDVTAAAKAFVSQMRKGLRAITLSQDEIRVIGKAIDVYVEEYGGVARESDIAIAVTVGHEIAQLEENQSSIPSSRA
jgi:hypothetical protein